MLISGSLCYNFDCLASIVVTVYGQSMILLAIFIRYLHPSLPLLMYMYTSHSHNECFLAPIYIAIHWTYSGCLFLTVVRIILVWNVLIYFECKPSNKNLRCLLLKIWPLEICWSTVFLLQNTKEDCLDWIWFFNSFIVFHQFPQDFRIQLFKKKNVLTASLWQFTGDHPVQDIVYCFHCQFPIGFFHFPVPPHCSSFSSIWTTIFPVFVCFCPQFTGPDTFYPFYQFMIKWLSFIAQLQCYCHWRISRWSWQVFKIFASVLLLFGHGQLCMPTPIWLVSTLPCPGLNSTTFQTSALFITFANCNFHALRKLFLWCDLIGWLSFCLHPFSYGTTYSNFILLSTIFQLSIGFS